MASPILIHSHAEGEAAGVGLCAAAGDGVRGEGACAEADTTGGGCAARAGGAEAADAALPGTVLAGAGRIVNVRAGNVAVRGRLVSVSHQETVSAGIV